MTFKTLFYWTISSFFTVIGLLFVGAAVSPVLAHTVEKGDVMIIHPWVEPISGEDTYAHPTISNEGDRPLVLIRVETPISGAVEILRNGKAITNLAIRGGDVIDFDNSEAQIRLTKLTRPLIDGTHFPARLVFTRNVNVDLEMVVGQDTMLMELSTSDKGESEEEHHDEHDEDSDHH